MVWTRFEWAGSLYLYRKHNDTNHRNCRETDMNSLEVTLWRVYLPHDEAQD